MGGGTFRAGQCSSFLVRDLYSFRGRASGYRNACSAFLWNVVL